jgi:muramoyltetrapeptide carboxypeptidase LdcA involved in peptidoglycan recycling
MGVRELRERFGLQVVEMPHTRADPDWIWRNPEGRAQDVNAAFADPSIDGIIATIGGDDSVRILPFLDGRAFAANPKVLLGYSDTTTLHVFALLNGLQTFYGPSVMAGIAENGGTLPYTEAAFRRALMMQGPIGSIRPSREWTAVREPWDDADRADERRPTLPNPGWSWQGGDQRVEGHLFGGCLEVLEFLKETPWWPPPDVWDGAVFYWELYPDAPDLDFVRYWLRSYGMQGILARLAAMLIGRTRDDSPDRRAELAKAVDDVVSVEFGRSDMPVVLGLDFGHTDPQMVIPNGGRAVIDPVQGRIVLG